MDDLVSALIGAVIGGLLGAVLPEYFRYRGKVYCAISNLSWDWGADLPPRYTSPPAYTFYIKAFNERQVGTGLRDVQVRFICEDEVKTDRPKHSIDPYFIVDYLNFPSGQWTINRLMAGENVSNDPDEVRKRKDCTKAKLFARLPNGKGFEVDIPMDDNETLKPLPGARPKWWWPFD